MLTLSHTSQNTLSKTKFQLESRVSFSYISNVRRLHYTLYGLFHFLGYYFISWLDEMCRNTRNVVPFLNKKKCIWFYKLIAVSWSTLEIQHHEEIKYDWIHYISYHVLFHYPVYFCMEIMTYHIMEGERFTKENFSNSCRIYALAYQKCQTQGSECRFSFVLFRPKHDVKLLLMLRNKFCKLLNI